MRKRTRLVWRLFYSYTAIVFGTLLATGWYVVHTLETFLVNGVVSELTERARLVGQQVIPHLDPLDAAVVDAICKRAGSDSRTRFTVILPSGRVVGDTWETPANMENHAGRPEVAGALAHGVADSTRFSTTMQRNIIYVAQAIQLSGNSPAAVVRASVPLSRVEEELAWVRARFIGIGSLIALLALLVTLAISQRHGRKVRELQQGAARLAQGDLSHRLEAPDSEELAGLADSVNRMAEQIESRMQAVIRERNQLEAVLSSMLEGVIAIDHEERVISLNPAAARWFNSSAEKIQGRTLQEVIRDLGIQKFVTQSLQGRTPATADMVVSRNGARILNIKSTPLKGSGPETSGALIVFSDVTQLRRLEEMRRDFVANVSHEIKTPLTAIKGFVETLHHGQVENPDEVRRFLGIIARHVDRLNAIIEDLLMLSRIENEAEHAQLSTERVHLRDIFENALQICRRAAEEKRIRIKVSGEEDLTASVDPVLLEQAVVNLLDNAVKYSAADCEVEIAARVAGSEIQISVQDRGLGIERKHLPRLFERFYRADKARSRSLGGTGLGLAIVKHIAQAHGGHVTVESVVGQGSRFTVHLPRTAAGP
jgi:two-component system, OmpR family, phosphate regulon sensor histidine kinase PhoR